MPYATVANVRAEGVPATIVDADIQASLNRWEQFINDQTGQHFDSRALTLDFDGEDSPILHLPLPVISVTQLFLNGNFTTAIAAADYRVYNARGPVRDDRRNPKIELIAVGDVFGAGTRVGTQPVFAKGSLNQRVVGNFGFTESDGTTPLLIREALIRLVLRDLLEQRGLGGTSSRWSGLATGARPLGPRVRESTDGHSIEYAAPRPGSISTVTGDPFVDDVLRRYRRPIRVAVTGSRRSYLG